MWVTSSKTGSFDKQLSFFKVSLFQSLGGVPGLSVGRSPSDNEAGYKVRSPLPRRGAACGRAKTAVSARWQTLRGGNAVF